MREQITERIRSEVLSQQLPVGTRVREEALAKQFGVSRAPVRDALLQLTSEGLLVAKPNCGMSVAPLPDKAIQPLVVALRKRIESFSLARLFGRFESIDLEAHAEIVGRLKEACQAADLSQVVYYDMAFHRFIIDAADDRQLVSMWLPIVSRMMLNYSRHQNWMESYEEHAAIAEAIRAGDRQLSRRLLLENIL
ncbi:MAG: GntR family transcriptional regulator [Verrucomicrobiota bacterium]